jgi:hypothetical protein
MLIIDFPTNLMEQNNLIKYKNIKEDDWYYMYIDMDILCLLLFNFGMVSTVTLPGIKPACCDNPSTGKKCCVKYCGADITILYNNSLDMWDTHMVRAIKAISN